MIIMSDTKEYIIDQAYSLFMNQSYEAVSISDISKACGLTKGALYHHFENKEALFMAVIDKYLILNEMNVYTEEKTVAQIIEETIDNVKKIVYFVLGEQPKYLPVNYLALAIDAMRHYPGFTTNKMQIMDKEVEKIKMVMDNAIERGEIRSDINTNIMAINYFSLSAGMATSILQNNSPQKAITLLQEQLNEFYNVLKC